jgi:hypothetical protein
MTNISIREIRRLAREVDSAIARAGPQDGFLVGPDHRVRHGVFTSLEDEPDGKGRTAIKRT